MRTKFVLLLFILLLASRSESQNVGIGTTSPLSQLSVGSSSQFRINSTGNIIRINDLPYSFPTSQGTNQYLKNDGAGNLTWAPVARPVVRIFSVVPNGGFSAWLIDNVADYASGSNADPTLVLTRGFTYHFNVNATGHPFFISSTPGVGSYATGITNNGEDNGTIIFTVPMDAPSTLYYYCSVHGAMNGTITIL
jgi:hypothetical protein